MKSKKEIPAICEAVFGRLPERSQWAWSAIADLEKTHKASAVIMDFRDWAAQNVGDDFPKGILKAYLDVASSRLSSNTTSASGLVRDPEVSNLVRELSYRSKGQISFMDKHKIRLSEVLSEFTAAEIIAAFSAWFEEQDLSDPKNVSYLPHQFVQKADQLCYTLRKQREEQERSKIARDAAAKRLQEEAEAARKQAELERTREEEKEFDPFG